MSGIYLTKWLIDSTLSSHQVELKPATGELVDCNTATTIPLSGFPVIADSFNSNGIEVRK